MAQAMTQAVRNTAVQEEMRRHRAAVPLKRPVHPGCTRVEAGLTAQQAELLAAGVCDELASVTERGERIAHGVLAGGTGLLIVFVAGQVLGWW